MLPKLKVRHARAREIQQVVDDFTGAEGLLHDLFDQRLPRIARRQLLGQHLNVAGNHCQRRIDLVRHAGCQQAQGGELLRLQELALQVRALGDVVEQDELADAFSFLAQDDICAPDGGMPA